MNTGNPQPGSQAFAVLDAVSETFRLLWTNRGWCLMRALIPAVLGGVTFIVTFPRMGLYAVWEMALFLISALFICNMLVSVHRHVVLGDPCRRFMDFFPRIVDLTYFGLWLALALIKLILDFAGVLLGSIVPLAGQVFDLGVVIVCFILLVRLIALFPLVAVRAKTPFRTAWKLSAGHVGGLIFFCLGVVLILALALGAVATLIYYSQLWLAPETPNGENPAMAGDLATTIPFLFGALFVMVELEAVAIAQSVAYRRLAGIKPEA